MNSFDVDEKLVKKLAGLLKETGLTEIEYEAEDRRIRVSAQASGAMSVSVPNISVPAAAPSVASTPAAAASTPQAGQLKSPMVGTAYLAASPGATPFVKIGDRVTKGQTLMIIEAMKVMNPIQAIESGIIIDIKVTDGQPVEYDDTLMIIQ